MTHKDDVTALRDNGFGKRLRAAREATGLSQQDVADAVVTAGRGRRTVNDWEGGRSVPTVPVFEKLCRLYRVTADGLLGLPEPEAVVSLRVIGRLANGLLDKHAIEAMDDLSSRRPGSTQEIGDAIAEWIRKRASGE